MEAKVYNFNKEVVGKISLPESVFGRKWNPDLVDQALKAEVANRRVVVAHAKGRGEVSGGGKKPWRQKGTGRARHGSIRSPLWSGGGVSLGPNKNRDFSLKINKKMKRGALYSLLSKKLSSENVMFLETLNGKFTKTKELDKALKTFLKADKSAKNLSVLLVADKDNKSIFKISRNIPACSSVRAKDLDVESVLRYKNILIEKNSIPEFKEVKSKIVK